MIMLQSELTAAVSLKNHVVLHTSSALMELLGYPLVGTGLFLLVVIVFFQ